MALEGFPLQTKRDNCVTRTLITAAIASLALYSATTAKAALPSLSGPNGYDRCLALVKHDPARATREAAAWANTGGGAAALHCEALALSALKRFPEAARTLESAAAAAGAANAPLRAELFDQAGNAWLLADSAAKAEEAFSSALVLSPKNEDILFDRARARGAAKDWTGAIEDLTAVLAADSDRADVYVLRASALHAQGKTERARADVARALSIYPAYPEALVERGTMRFETGDRTGARADWQEAAREAPDSNAGAAARARLAQFSESSPKKK
jgi:tetratricopeptide (TPR) repeat protein